MGRIVPRRLGACLLLFAFVGGGLGLPDLDALLFHTGRPSPEQIHLDQPGGCGAHAEHCVLAMAASLRQLGAPPSGDAPLVNEVAEVRPVIPVATPRSPDHRLLPLSRAPPAPAS